MSVLCDQIILERCLKKDMISPYVESQIKIDKSGKRVISFGPSSYGYDVRCAFDMKIFSPTMPGLYADPKKHEDLLGVDINALPQDSGKTFLIPPNGFGLVHSIEYIKNAKRLFGNLFG